MKGYTQVYTGNGKGKTTAAIGLAIRAAGANLRVFFAQFVKGRETSELEALARFKDLIAIRRFGTGCFVRGKPSADDLAAAREGMCVCREAMLSGDYQVVVLDEANVASHFGLIGAEELLDLIEAKPEGIELVITGREADPRVIDHADLVTEMREIKHYFAQGIRARRGIEE